jgi:DHA1 family multidrug resistance protein-like MFS transporter
MFKGVNKVMRAYIYWDFVMNAAWGLLAPVFAIFVLENIAIKNASMGVEIVGYATFFYWITKSLLQIPIGYYLDKKKGEIDDFWFYVIGAVITSIVPFGYIFSSITWHIYFLQILHGIGMSMIIPSSYGIFIRHIDKDKEAYESSLDSTLLGIGAGIAGALGGIIVAYIGFKAIFIITGSLSLLSVIFLFPAKKHMLPKTKDVQEIPPFQGHVDY